MSTIPNITGAVSKAERNAKDAFTLIELLAVVAVLAVLGVMLVPALARSKIDGNAMVCLNNKRQLTIAWRMYADDNNGQVTLDIGSGAIDGFDRNNWVRGQMNYGNSHDATNLSLMLSGRLGPYVGNDGSFFKCPADKSVAAPGGVTSPRVRSISMNTRLGDSSATLDVLNIANIIAPDPSHFFIFMDENPDTIDDGGFYENKSDNQWIDYPGYYHNNSSCLSFADGHAELHRWLDSTTTPAITGQGRPTRVVVPNTSDRLWLVGQRMYP